MKKICNSSFADNDLEEDKYNLSSCFRAKSLSRLNNCSNSSIKSSPKVRDHLKILRKDDTKLTSKAPIVNNFILSSASSESLLLNSSQNFQINYITSKFAYKRFTNYQNLRKLVTIKIKKIPISYYKKSAFQAHEKPNLTNCIKIEKSSLAKKHKIIPMSSESLNSSLTHSKNDKQIKYFTKSEQILRKKIKENVVSLGKIAKEKPIPIKKITKQKVVLEKIAKDKITPLDKKTKENTPSTNIIRKENRNLSICSWGSDHWNFKK
ncbi:unnamed protein product [Blepharisma stoltei]|uniref:Uncharacterized protein n=1 Tax=Blepharisma stoltei TaxID=1481888 RepID=A0AAU9JQK8_9CILI|nr:unnamed protein product [Blepharisma stoltei]